MKENTTLIIQKARQQHYAWVYRAVAAKAPQQLQQLLIQRVHFGELIAGLLTYHGRGNSPLLLPLRHIWNGCQWIDVDIHLLIFVPSSQDRECICFQDAF